MDSEKTLSFQRQPGVFLPRWALFLLVLLVLSGLVAVGLLVSYLVPPKSSCASGVETTVGPQTPTSPPVRPFSKLPTSLEPESYRLELQPFLNNFTFRGRVSVTVLAREATRNVTLHAVDLDVDPESATIRAAESRVNSVPAVTRVTRDLPLDFLILELGGTLQPELRYEVSLNFTGTLSDRLSGFYRSSYKDEAGNTRWLATTQFQPTDARRAFPCFDEPALKATFDITLVHWSNMSAISNMPRVRNESRGDGWEADSFNTSVRMSTYLLAFIVSDFDKITNREVSVWAKPQGIQSAKYALDIAPKILDFFGSFFQIPFPLPKMDLVAIPDFSPGAMENWGLITFRETALLFDPRVGSSGNQQRVATVVAHELAHQWFGNLVTPKWWDDLWLNEGFASYVEYLGVTAVEPTWEMDQQFVSDELQNVMGLDCLKTSHPISQPVGHPDEINEIFDRISYGKGATVIRMMNYFLGNETFKRGLTNYLRAKAYGNAVQDDLWEFLTNAQDNVTEKIDVKKVMDSWTLQTGFPVVTLTRDYKSGTGSITQVRFLLDRNDTTSKTDYSWEVPISYTDGRELSWTPKTRVWLHRDNISVSGLPDDTWVILNLQQSAYFRVNYDIRNWELLRAQLMSDHSKIHVVNRAQILDDAFNLARAGLLPYDLALNLTEYLEREKDYLSWTTAFNNFQHLSLMLDKTDSYGIWKKYLLKKIDPLYKELTWTENPEDGILKKFLRIQVLSWACSLGNRDCVQNATALFAAWRNAPANASSTVASNLRGIVYCNGVREGEDDSWDFVWDRYLKEQDSSEKDKLMQALACSREPWLLSRYLRKSLDPESGIRRQDGSTVFRTIAVSKWGHDLAYNYFRDQWSVIYDTYGKSFFAISSMVKAVGSQLTTQFELDELKEFRTKQEARLGTAARTFDQTIEAVQANVQWGKDNYQAVAEWLQRVDLK